MKHPKLVFTVSLDTALGTRVNEIEFNPVFVNVELDISGISLTRDEIAPQTIVHASTNTGVTLLNTGGTTPTVSFAAGAQTAVFGDGFGRRQ